MKKVLNKVLGFSLSFLVIFSMFASLASAEEVAKGKTFQEMYFDLNTNLLSQREIQEFQNLGWNVEEGKITKTRVVKDGDIMVNGVSTPIIDGEFEVVGNPDIIEVETAEGLVSVSKNSDNEFIVVQEVDWAHLIDHMDSTIEPKKLTPTIDDNRVGIMGYGDKYKEGDWVHCNRANGPFSDGVHYDKKKNPVAAVRNFTGSDCDLALLSWRKCDDSNWCNVKGKGIAAACSVQIGHKKTYHKHNVLLK